MSTTSKFGKSYEQIIDIYEKLLNGKNASIAFSDENTKAKDEFCKKFYSITNARIELTQSSGSICNISLKK